MRAFESQKKLIERKEDNETRIACCSQKTIFDFKTEPFYECLCLRKRCTRSCKNEERQRLKSSTRIGPNPSEREDNTGPSPKVLNLIEQKNRPEKFEEPSSRILQKCNDPSKYQNSENFISNATEDLCECEYFENSTIASTELSGRPYLKDSKIHEGKHLQERNLNESFRSVGTGITPRQAIDENVVPLLKSIFDVLQTMRQEKLHLGPIASKNIDIHLDEPFNGLPPPAPPSSPKFSKHLLGISSDSEPNIFKSSRNNLKFEKATNQEFINSEDNLAVLEPPERDVEKNCQDTSTRSQRLIPVNMDLLRTDEELIWEPDSNFDQPEVEPLKPQFRKFPEEARFESREMFKNCESKSCLEETSQDLHNSEKAESTTRLSNLKRSSSVETESCDCTCEEPENCAEDCYRKPFNTMNCSHHQITTPTSLKNLRIYQNQEKDQTKLKIQVSQAIQVNSVSLQNLTSRSEQFLSFNYELKDLSEEKLIKTSEFNKSKDTLLSKVNSQKNITKFDVGTDCIDFDNDVDTESPNIANDDRSSTKSCHCSQEPTKSQNQEMSQFIESILFDLKAMNSFRKNNSHWQSFARLPCASTGGWQRPSKDLSYPVTIETVQELGANSLFVKWRVQNFGNIGGYEIFLNGHLTNRYFNCIHQAAVICDVNLHCSHRITLRAQPLFPLSNSMLASDSCSSSTSNKKYPSNLNTHPEASCPQPDGSVWYPSVYHFEPNSLAAPINAVLY